MKKQLLFGAMFASVVMAVNAQVSAPAFSFDCKDGETKVTLANADGAEIWYNFTGSNSTDDSQKYFAPFFLTAPADVTAFAISGESKSEIATKRVVVNNARVYIDAMSTFDPSKAHEQFVANDGYCFDWKDVPTSGVKETVDLTGGDWKLTSMGQVMQVVPLKNNAVVNTTSHYEGHPESLMDGLLFAQSYQKLYDDALLFGKTADADSYARIVSLCKFMSPLDVVVLASKQGSTKELTCLKVEYSVDGESWIQMGDVIPVGLANSWTFGRRMYSDTNEIFIRVSSAGVQIHGIYILSEGELSRTKKAEYNAEYEAWLATSINSIPIDSAVNEVYYTLDGRQLEGKPTEKGVYLFNGKKVYVK